MLDVMFRIYYTQYRKIAKLISGINPKMQLINASKRKMLETSLICCGGNTCVWRATARITSHSPPLFVIALMCYVVYRRLVAQYDLVITDKCILIKL